MLNIPATPGANLLRGDDGAGRVREECAVRLRPEMRKAVALGSFRELGLRRGSNHCGEPGSSAVIAVSR